MEDGVEIGNLVIPVAKGDKGYKGDAGKIVGLSVTMLESTATPTVTNTGTAYEANYTLGIPRGTGVASVEINDDGELVITLTDETELNLGVVVGTSISSIYLDSSYNFMIELTDDTEINAGNLETMLEFILNDYYTKSETYSKGQIDDELSDFNTLVTKNFAHKLYLSIDPSTYVLTVGIYDYTNTLLDTKTVDLPLESMVVSGSYDSVNKKVVLTLQSGSTVEFSVADLVAGLQTEITPSNKLSADLVTDTSTTNKFVTSTEKTNIAKIPNSLMITKLTENLAITTGNTPSLAEGYYYTGSYHVTVNGDTVDSLDDAIFYLNKSNEDFEFQLIKIWGSGLGYPYVAIDRMAGEDEIYVQQKAPVLASQIVTSISSSSRDTQIPSAKCVYDIVGDIETALQTLNTGGGVE